MRIVITGANGQLGRELRKQFSEEHKVIPFAKNELDITNNENVEQQISTIKPDLIVHAAAYTAVDDCEINRQTALEINALGAGNVAKIASKIGAKMFYISTDYVFDGDKNAPYYENDQPFPSSMYGLSKWVGEQIVQTLLKESYIIRTSWLYGHDGKNFVKTMLKLAEQGREIKVVNDQVGSPTYTVDLVKVIRELIDREPGIYHVSNSGSCSWYQFAKVIFKEAGFNQSLVKPTTTKEFGALAPRPAYSVLANNAIEKVGINPLRHWQEGLKAFILRERNEAND